MHGITVEKRRALFSEKECACAQLDIVVVYLDAGEFVLMRLTSQPARPQKPHVFPGWTWTWLELT